MQKYILGLLLCFPFSISAQPIAVMLDKMNVLFAGIDNPLHVVASDVPAGRLILIPSRGAISKDSSGAYLWRLCTFDSTRAWLVLADSVADNPFDTLYFRVKRLPEPEFLLAKGRHHSSGGIRWVFHNDNAEGWDLQLLSFEAEFYFRKQDPVLFVNRGRRFSGEVSEHINKLNPGCQVIFSNFRWTGGCDPTVRCSEQSLYFLIK